MFNFQPQTHKPVKPGFLLAVAVGILALVLSLVQAPTVSAMAYKDMVPSQQAKSWAYTNAVQWCIKYAQTSSFDLSDTSNQSRITPGDAASGKWWQDSWNLQQGPEETVTSTYLHESANSDGVTTCNNVLRDGAQLWGYGTDFMSLMCDITGTRANNSSCRTGNGDFGSISGSDGFFRQKINEKVYGGSGIALKNEALYWLYYTAFTKGCQAKVTTIPAGEGNGDMIYRDIKTVDDKGAIKTDTYEGVSKGQDKRIYVDENLNRHSQNCGYIADRVNEYAPALAAWHRLPANKDKTDTPATVNASGEENPDGSASSCRVDGIGWILCPAINFTAGIVDKAYIFVEALLVTPALNVNTASPSNGTYVTWSIMRNIANVAFVIAFLVIIYSQLTGVGVTNYGIKKLLPKLVVAAILVNVSYWICALAIDISNILGTSVTSLIDSITSKVPLPPSTVATSGGEVWGPLAAAVLASATIAILGLTVLLPLLIAALAAIVTVLVVLVLRQALIVILVVVAPLAFVALLLPNTEDLFKRWRQLFQTLLLMFPIIAVIFAGSELASRTITSSTYSSISGGSAYNGNMILQIVGAGVAIIPLFITPIVMKTAGGLLNRFAGFVNNPNKGVFDRMRKGADGLRTSRQALRDAKSYNRTGIGRALDIRGYSVRHRGRSEAVLKARQREAQLGAASDVANLVENGTGPAAWNLKRQLSGGGGEAGRERAITNAANTLDQLEIAEVKAAQAILQRLNLDKAALSKLEQGGEVTVGGNTYQGGSVQKAALSNAVKEQRISDIEKAATSLDNQANGGETLRFLANSIRENYGTTKAKGVHMVDANNLHKLASGSALTDTDLDTATLSAMEGISANLMATQKKDTLVRVKKVQLANPGSAGAVNAKSSADNLTKDKELFNQMGQDERAIVTSIS